MDRAEPVSTSLMDITNGGVFVKGEEEYIGIFFEPEEEIVEREIKRPLTATPEEFTALEREDTQSSREKKPGREHLLDGPKTAAGWRYRIRRDLLAKQGRKYHGLYMCPGCLERKKLRLIRVNKNGDRPGVADYVLLCDLCRKKRQEKEKKTRLWTRKPGPRGGSSQSSEMAFFNSIRALIFERDGKACVWCGAKEKLGLGPLIPKSRGGKLCFDNYVVTCQKCRGSKGNKLPLEYIFEKVNFDFWMSEQSEDMDVVVKNPGARVRINMHLVAEIQQYLHKIAAGVEINRSKAERLAIKLSESDEDRRRERQQQPW